MNDTIVTLIGNATNGELRFTPNGKALFTFRLASTPRRFNKSTNQYEDGETLWMTCNVWGKDGENLAETIGQAKSMRVILQGRLRQESFQTREGESRTAYKVDVDEIGPSVKFASAQVTRAPREGGQGGDSSGGWGGNQGNQWGGQQPQGDPWGGAPASAPAGAPDDSEPPF